MKWLAAAGLCLVTGLIIWGEYRSAKERKARLAVAFIACSALVLALILIIHPELPGPTEFMNLIVGGLSRRLGLE
ncbi:hypothetical protein K0T92_20300 [Paenibacillus oenotherae]|uniref:Uncharacterized protein n=1 Tax=Paenibacillus oenotherae TaxID=1435645 RepID=A0ABS7DAU2_9BACL|nr:hypothetical protein [Paenibacillus oenotherae]MBW7477063.1 hypothetical protein [Paenibacillus oenotherae]